MTNPYEPGTTVHIDHEDHVRRPWLLCMAVTCTAIPVWFVGFFVVMTAGKPIDNPAGIPIYMMMVLFASVFVVPLNAFLCAPMIATITFPKLSRVVLVHILLGGGILAALSMWPSIPFPDWTIVPFYLSVFLFPPLLVGSLAYSLRYYTLNREVGANKAVNRITHSHGN